jgi:hypothetical protein
VAPWWGSNEQDAIEGIWILPSLCFGYSHLGLPEAEPYPCSLEVERWSDGAHWALLCLSPADTLNIWSLSREREVTQAAVFCGLLLVSLLVFAYF